MPIIFSRTLVPMLLAAQLFVACAPSTVSQLTREKDAKKLSADEIVAMAKGNTLFLTTHKVNSYFYFDDSGHAFAKDIYNNEDTGWWDVSEKSELCFKMKNWWYAKLGCFTVYQDNKKYYLFNSSDVLAFTAEHMAGDSKHLYYELKKSEKNYLISKKSIEKPREASDPEPSQDNQDSTNIIEQGTPTKEELQSTVKWMAKDCPGCNLADTNLAGAELIGAKLQGANLSGTNLSRANLRRAELREANLENADLSYANLPGANLRDSNLTNAVFKGANLIRADFTGAEIEGANFEGALLEGAEGLIK